MNAINANDHMEEGTSLEEKREYLAEPELFPQENAFVAEEDGGRLIAFGTVRLHRDVTAEIVVVVVRSSSAKRLRWRNIAEVVAGEAELGRGLPRGTQRLQCRDSIQS